MDFNNLNEDDISEAFNNLADTDIRHGKLYSHLEYLKEAMKQAKAHEFLKSEGTVAERQEKAIASVSYDIAVRNWIQALEEYKILDNERNSQARIFDMFQTLSANRRKGML
jgi:F0F1-type ATP synthase delta subunit